MVKVLLSQEKLKAKRRKRLFWKIFGIVSALVIIFCGISFLSSLSFWQVQKINISGVGETEAAALRAAALNSLLGTDFYFFPRTNIFLAPIKSIASDISKNFSDIDKVSVSRKLFSTIDIVVERKTEVALWCIDSACDVLDSSGTAFETASSVATSSSIVFGNGNIPHIGMSPLPSAQFVPLLIFVSDLPQRNIIPTAVGIAPSEVDIFVGTSTKLIVDPTKDLSKSLSNLDLVLSEKTAGISADTIDNLEYLDLRFPDKVFYK